MLSNFIDFLNVTYSLQRAAAAGDKYAFQASNGNTPPDMATVEQHLAQAAAKAGNNTALRLNVLQGYVKAADNPFCPDDQSDRFLQQGRELLRDEATLRAFAGACVESVTPRMLDLIAPFSVAHLQVCDRLMMRAFPENGEGDKPNLACMALNSLPLTLAASYFARIPALTDKMVRNIPDYMTYFADRLDTDPDKDNINKYVARQIRISLITHRPLVLFNPLSLRKCMGYALGHAAENPARAAELAERCIEAIPTAVSRGQHDMASDLLDFANRLCHFPLAPENALHSRNVFISPKSDLDRRLFITRPTSSQNVADIQVISTEGKLTAGEVLLRTITATSSADELIRQQRTLQLAHDTLGNCCSPSLFGAWSTLCSRRATTDEQQAVARHLAQRLSHSLLPG